MTRIEALTRALRGAQEGGRGFTLTSDEAGRVADVLELAQALPACRLHLTVHLQLLRDHGETATAHAVANLLTAIGDTADVLND